MFLITNEQMEALTADLRARSENAILARLEQAFDGGACAWLRPEWRRVVRRLVERARDYGIEDPDDVAGYVELVFHVGREDFERQPEYAWAAEILADPNGDPAAKVEYLQRIVAERQAGAGGAG